MPKQTFRLNGKKVKVKAKDSERVLWVLRDLMGVTGPKYGCGINVCKACTSHLNGKAFNPCATPIGKIKPTDEITTIEGISKKKGKKGKKKVELHPMQKAWIKHDVAQCGYCQPGQIMAAIALVKRTRKQGREIKDSDLDAIRNICRCGTYDRIRDAIKDGAKAM